MKRFILSLYFMIILWGTEQDSHFDEYLGFVKKYSHLGDLGNYKNGHIEIVIERNTVKKIEEAQAKRYIKEGESPDQAYNHARIGIVSKDKYWIWVRDAVIFPSGASGTFNRIVKTGSLYENVNNGVAIIPVDLRGNIVLNVMYRHAIRDWVLELPRGSIEKGEDALSAAKRELKEETGMDSDKSFLLGEVTPDSGTVASVVPIYLIKVSSKGKSTQDYSEAILTTVGLSVNQVKKAIELGYYDIIINKRKIRVLVKDSYLSSAILLAEQKNLL